MYKIKTLNKISDIGLKVFDERFEVKDEFESPDAIIVRSADMHSLELPESVKAIGRAGVGVNNIPLEKFAEKGVVVFNTPGANANAVKELVIAALLLSSRGIVDSINWANSLKGKEDVPKLVEKGKSNFAGPEIAGKKLGIFGLGAIGALVAEAATALGMEVIGYDPFISVAGAWALPKNLKPAASEDEIYRECDYITVHLPFNAETKEKYNAEVFSKVKQGVRFINLARGELFDNKALIKALEDGIVSAYVTDFPTDELIGVKNAICIPHLGASTPESEENCAFMAAQQVKDYLTCGNIKNAVTFPNCEMPYVGTPRICIIHKNVPNVISPITTVLANKNINIGNMVNKSKGNYAYMIIDIDSEKTDGLADELEKLEEVIKVRIIK